MSMRSVGSSLQSLTPSERWSLANAAAMLAAAAGAVWLDDLGPLLYVGLAMLGVLVVAGRKNWTPQGGFGVANGITALRVALLGLLPAAATAGPGILISLSLFIFGLDGLDGWFARRRTLTSEFGAFFDKETDALFLLLLCGLTAFRGPLPTWILGAGLLRYGFVLVLFALPTPETTEARSTMARYVYGFMVGALLTSFLPYPIVYRPLVAVATGGLLFSFGRSFWRIVPRWQTLGGS